MVGYVNAISSRRYPVSLLSRCAVFGIQPADLTESPIICRQHIASAERVRGKQHVQRHWKFKKRCPTPYYCTMISLSLDN